MYEPHMVDFNTVKLFSDSSKKGFGACYGFNWIQGVWPSKWKDFHINILELCPILALVETFSHKFRNSVIHFHCDNSSVDDVFNKQSTKDSVIMVIVRRMVLRLLDLKTRFVAVHILGVTNHLCDALSWFQENPSLLRRYNMVSAPTVIPEQSLPVNLILQ